MRKNATDKPNLVLLYILKMNRDILFDVLFTTPGVFARMLSIHPRIQMFLIRFVCLYMGECAKKNTPFDDGAAAQVCNVIRGLAYPASNYCKPCKPKVVEPCTTSSDDN